MLGRCMVTMIFQSPGVNPGASKPPQGNASSKGRPSRGSRLWAKRRLWTGASLFFFVGRVLCQAEGGGKVLGKQCKGGDAILLALNCNKFCFRALQAIIVSKKVEGPAYQVHLSQAGRLKKKLDCILRAWCESREACVPYVLCATPKTKPAHRLGQSRIWCPRSTPGRWLGHQCLSICGTFGSGHVKIIENPCKWLRVYTYLI